VRHLDRLVLVADRLGDVTRKWFLESLFVSVLCRVLAAFALVEHSGLVLAGNSRFEIDPAAMKSSGSAARGFRLFSKLLDDTLQLTGKMCTLLRELKKERFEVRAFDTLGCLFEALLPILTCLDEFI